jgi:hypothetical protein
MSSYNLGIEAALKWYRTGNKRAAILSIARCTPIDLASWAIGRPERDAEDLKGLMVECTAIVDAARGGETRAAGDERKEAEGG